jgi:hypothetical protein
MVGIPGLLCNKEYLQSAYITLEVYSKSSLNAMQREKATNLAGSRTLPRNSICQLRVICRESNGMSEQLNGIRGIVFFFVSSSTISGL